jgi:hypothetical protein
VAEQAIEVHARPKVTLEGEQFGMAENVGAMPLMRFAKVAKSGGDSANLDGLVAMYDLLEQCIEPSEWVRFQAHADRVRADGEKLMAVVSDVFQALADRPTGRPSASSGGPKNTKPRSVAGSSSKVIKRLEREGRPDLALMVTMAQEALSERSA